MRDLGRAAAASKKLAKTPMGAGASTFDSSTSPLFESIPVTIETIVKDHGRIDALVNNAASFSMSVFPEDMSLDELRRQFDTNFFGVVAMSKAVISAMRQQR